jgi:hypothetical protein
MHVRRVLAALVVTIGVMGGTSLTAAADQPGPGSKQCAPGQHGNPHPGFKPGGCRR